MVGGVSRGSGEPAERGRRGVSYAAATIQLLWLTAPTKLYCASLRVCVCVLLYCEDDIYRYLIITFHIHSHVLTLYTLHTQRERVCYLLVPARGLYCRSLASFHLLTAYIGCTREEDGRQEHTEDASHNHRHYDLLLQFQLHSTFLFGVKGTQRMSSISVKTPYYSPWFLAKIWKF